jgi:hypothetical protein
MPGTEITRTFKSPTTEQDWQMRASFWAERVLFWAFEGTSKDAQNMLDNAIEGMRDCINTAAEQPKWDRLLSGEEIDQRVWNLFETAAPEFEPTISVEQASLQLADVLFRLEEQGFRINIVVPDDEDSAFLNLSFPELKHHDRIIARNGHGEWEDYPA